MGEKLRKPLKRLIYADPEFNVELVSYPGGYRYRPHSHTEPGITLVVAGGLEETVEQTSSQPRAGSIVVKPPEHKHSVRFSPDETHTVAISFGEAFFSDKPPSFDFGHWYTTNARATRQAAFAVMSTLAQPGACRKDAIVDLVATLDPTIGDLRRRKTPPQWLARVASHISQSCLTPLNVTEIAANMQRHPVAVARQFRRFYGCSLREYHQQMRAAHVMGRTFDQSQSITTIAHDAGFHDSSHLSHSFLRHTGLSPRQYRRIGQALFA